MNTLRKNAAVTKYKGILAANPTMTADELRELIAADDKKFPPDEIDEILAAVLESAGDKGSDKTGSEQGEEPKANANKTFEEWTVEPQFEKIELEGQKPYNRLKKGEKGFEKVKLIKTVAITPDRAELLNTQSVNSKIRYYEKA